MRAAKIQKATLDPLKISGRCGRLMCCLRYEDATYEELRKRLPKNKTRVGTAEGPGIVVDSKILVQLVLVRLDPPPGAFPGEFGPEIAVPVEELMDPDACPAPGEAKAPDPMRGMSQRSVREKLAAERGAKLAKQDRYREKAGGPAQPVGRDSDASLDGATLDGAKSAQSDSRANASEAAGEPGDGATKKKRRRKRKKRGGGAPDAPNSADGSAPSGRTANDAAMRAASDADASDQDDDGDDDAPDASETNGAAVRDAGGESGAASGDGTPRKRKRRRRRRGGGNRGNGSTDGPPPTAS